MVKERDDLSFDLSSLPEEERRDAQLLAYHLFNLDSLVEQFRYAVLLIEHSAKQRGYSLPWAPATHWAVMAGEHAALTIYHFRSTLNAIGERVGQCRSIVGKVDTKALEKTKERFAAEFPNAKHIRDAVGHSADRMFKPENVDEHAVGARGQIVTLQIYKGNFIVTHKQDVPSLPVDDWALRTLNELTNRVYEAFGKLLSPQPKDRTSRQSRSAQPRAQR